MRNDLEISISFLRQIGLIAHNTEQFLGDSSDGVCSLNIEGESCFAGIEIKTMTSVSTNSQASHFASTYSNLVLINDIGKSDKADELFRKAVPNTEYRSQCLHHAAVLQTNNILYVVATSTLTGSAGIIYLCLLNFDAHLVNDYMFCLRSIFLFGF